MIHYHQGYLYTGNCVEVMQTFDDECIDLTVTSPPYDNLRDYEGYTFNFEAIARELYRVTKKGGVVVWVVADQTINGSETGTSFRQALYFKEIGFNLHDTMIWHKTNPGVLTHNRYEQYFEYMFCFSKYIPKTFSPIMTNTLNAGLSYIRESTDRHKGKENKSFRRHINRNWIHKEEKIKGNIWSFMIGQGNSSKDKEAFNHPAIFPERLAEDHILSWSNAGDTILDPMCGSGTTCKMALKNNRRFIGIDISEKYIGIAKQRIDQFIKTNTPDLMEVM